MKIQIDFPDENDMQLKVYQIKNNLKTKAEAVVELAKQKLSEIGTL